MARGELERSVAEGKIRADGWSTDRTDAAAAFCNGPGCVAVQQQLSIFDGNLELLAMCEEVGLASINRSPLGMGILTGTFIADGEFNDDDVRGSAPWFPGLEDGRPAQRWIDALDSVRDVLTSDGRTPARGAIAGLWAEATSQSRSPGSRPGDRCARTPVPWNSGRCHPGKWPILTQSSADGTVRATETTQQRRAPELGRLMVGSKRPRTRRMRPDRRSRR